MQVNSFNTNNYQQHAQKPALNPSFKSIIPTEIMLNGKKVTDKNTVLGVYRHLRKILAQPKSVTSNPIKKAFFDNNKTFAEFCAIPRKTVATRYELVDGDIYTFNGKHAEELEQLRNSVKQSGKYQHYYDKVSAFVYDKRTHSHLHSPKGDELMLKIHVTAANAKSKPVVESVEFLQMGAFNQTPLPPVIEKPVNKTKTSLVSFPVIPTKKARSFDFSKPPVFSVQTELFG